MWIERILGPVGHQPPGHRAERSHSVPLGDDVDRVGRGDIPIGLEPLGDDLVDPEVLG